MCRKRTDKGFLNPRRVRLEVKMGAIVLCLLLIVFVVLLGNVIVR